MGDMGSEERASSPPEARGEQKHSTYLQGWPLLLLALALCLTSCLITLYVGIIATAVPSITHYFNTIEDIDWYSTAYLLALCSAQPLAGKIYGLFRLKYTYLVFIGVFEIGALICALSKSSAVFILGRAVSGLGASGLFNGAVVMFTAVAPPPMRPMLIGISMALTAIGGVVGPVVGGAITQYLGWQWCLWIFLPPGGAVALVFLLLRIPEPARKDPAAPFRWSELPRRLDLVGFLLFAPAITMVLLALSWGGQRHPWNSATVIGLLVGGAGGAAVFAVWTAYRKDEALIPPGILKKSVVLCGSITSFLQGGSFLMVGYYLPLWFQSVQRATPTSSGVMLLSTAISQIVSSSVCGILISTVGYVPPWAILGNALSCVGAGLMTTFTPGTTEGQWIGYQILVGAGRGFILQLPVTAVQAALPDHEVSIASASLFFCQYFGGTVFLAVAKTIFLNRLRPALVEFAPGVNPDKIVKSGATDILAGVSPKDAPGVIEAYNTALVATFYLPLAASILAFFFSFGLGWKKLPTQRRGRRKPPTHEEEVKVDGPDRMQAVLGGTESDHEMLPVSRDTDSRHGILPASQAHVPDAIELGAKH